MIPPDRPRHVSCLPHLPASPTIALMAVTPVAGERSAEVALTCPNCGNDKNFLVKSLQMHVVHVEDARVEVSEESRPAVLEVLCDECDSALKLEDLDDSIRREVLLTIGAR